MTNDRPCRVPSGIPVVDQVLAGGWLTGGIGEIVGDAGVGKTSLALASAQGARGAAYCDLLGHLTPHLTERWQLPKPFIHFVPPPEATPQSVLEATRLLVEQVELVIWDDLQRFAGPGLYAHLPPLLVPLAERGHRLLLITHHDLPHKPPPGGWATSFYGRQRLEMRLLAYEAGQMRVHLRCLKNVGAPAFRRATLTLPLEDPSCPEATSAPASAC